MGSNNLCKKKNWNPRLASPPSMDGISLISKKVIFRTHHDIAHHDIGSLLKLLEYLGFFWSEEKKEKKKEEKTEKKASWVISKAFPQKNCLSCY